MIRKLISNLYHEIIAPSADKNKPAYSFWVGSSYGVILFILLVSGIIGYNYLMGISPILMMLSGITLGFIGLMIASIIFWLLSKAFSSLPQFFLTKLLGAAGLFIFMGIIGLDWPKKVLYSVGFVLLFYTLVIAVFSGSFYTFLNIKKVKKRTKIIALASALITGILIIYGLVWISCSEKNDKLTNYRENNTAHTIKKKGIGNPADSGNFSIEYFTYGSGTDIHRAEFNKKARFITPKVNASNLLPQWKGINKEWREQYWKFGVEAFPLNARVWMPFAKEPLPLILIVHGNHNMEDYSDDGYAYLAKLLSSRGFITVSVDENFINGTWTGGFRGKEMPVRAWLLLKHLELWNNWNKNPKHPFYNKIDMKNIILIGHSRGGEAVAIATKFNKLRFFPDNANEQFNFNFGIKGIIAIAPTDYRYERKIILDNINYLTLHGSYDNEVISFYGLRQYYRLQLADSTDRIKTGIYIHRANHANFNSKWSSQHLGLTWILNKKPLLSKMEQEQATKVFISAFSELIFNSRREYVALFQNAFWGKEWLPPTLYLNNFQDNKSLILLDFEKDIDLIKDKGGIEIIASNFKIWREEELSTRNGDSQGNKALVLGWNNKDQEKQNLSAKYSINISNALPIQIDSSYYLLLSVAAGDITELGENEKSKRTAYPDFSIELEDSKGNQAKIVLSKIKKIAPRLKIQVLKSKFLNDYFIGDLSETNLETFVIPLNAFKNKGNFNPIKLHTINIVFDQVDQGIVILDDIGFGKP